MWATAGWPAAHKQDYDAYYDPRFLQEVPDELIFAVAPWLQSAMKVSFP